MWPPDEELEPNVFYEPRTAVSPYFVMLENDDGSYDHVATLTNREEAEEDARQYANNVGGIYFVAGCVSISSCPPPVKASTRALV